jgi:hypothetical protein
MLKVFSLWLAEPQGALTLVRSYATQHAERLARYEAIRATMEGNAATGELRRLHSPRFASYATLMRGIEYERGYVAWCQWLIEIIEADDPGQPQG